VSVRSLASCCAALTFRLRCDGCILVLPEAFQTFSRKLPITSGTEKQPQHNFRSLYNLDFCNSPKPVRASGASSFRALPPSLKGSPVRVCFQQPEGVVVETTSPSTCINLCDIQVCPHSAVVRAEDSFPVPHLTTCDRITPLRN